MKILGFWGEFGWGFKRLGEDGECHRGNKGVFGMGMAGRELCEGDEAVSLLRCSRHCEHGCLLEFGMNSDLPSLSLLPTVCQILPKGVVGVLGPSSSPASSSIISNICGEKEVSGEVPLWWSAWLTPPPPHAQTLEMPPFSFLFLPFPLCTLFCSSSPHFHHHHQTPKLALMAAAPKLLLWLCAHAWGALCLLLFHPVQPPFFVLSMCWI